MADGSSKPIEEVEIGEQVLSYDFDQRVLVAKTVCLRDNPIRNRIVDIRFGDGRMVSSSTDHPYWVKEKGWCSVDPQLTISHYAIFRENGIAVRELEEGDELLVASVPREQNDSIVMSEITLKAVVERVAQPTSLWILRVGKYDADWVVTKRRFESAKSR